MKNKLTELFLRSVFFLLPNYSRRVMLLTSTFAYISDVCFGIDVLDDDTMLIRFGTSMQLSTCPDIMYFPVKVYRSIIREDKAPILKEYSVNNCIYIEDNPVRRDLATRDRKLKPLTIDIERAVTFAEEIINAVPRYCHYSSHEKMVEELVSMIANVQYFHGIQRTTPVIIETKKEWSVV